MKKQYLQYVWIVIIILLFAGILYGEHMGRWDSFDPVTVSLVEPPLKLREDLAEEETVPTQSSGEITNGMNLDVPSEELVSEQLECQEENTTSKSTENVQISSSGSPAIPSDSDMEDTAEPQTEPQVGFHIDKSLMICNFYDGNEMVREGYLTLPTEGCVGIRSGAFATYAGDIIELFVPSNIMRIERGAFVGLNGLEWLDVGNGNAQVQSVDGILYDSMLQEMIAYPTARTGLFSVPSSVSIIWSQAFYNTALSKIDLLDCGYVQFEDDVFGPNQGEGLTIRVPAQYEAEYRTDLSGYEVQIESVGP